MRLMLPILVIAAGVAAPADTWLVAVGIERYQDGSIGRFRYASADARALATAMHLAGVRSDRISVLTSDGPSERQPTRAAVMDALAQAKFAAAEDDLIIYYFAGHATGSRDQPYEVDLRYLDESAELPTTYDRTHRALCDWLYPSGTQDYLFIFDIHRADLHASERVGGADGAQALPDAFVGLARFDGSSVPQTVFPRVLMPCGAGELAWPIAAAGHGAFVHFLIRGLRGDAAEADGTVRLAGLARYLVQEVGAWAATEGLRQTPHFENPFDMDPVVLDSTADRARRTGGNQPPRVTVQGFEPGQTRLVVHDVTDVTIDADVSDDADGVRVTTNGRPMRLSMIGPDRWRFQQTLRVDADQAATVELVATDAAGLATQVSCAVRRLSPVGGAGGAARTHGTVAGSVSPLVERVRAAAQAAGLEFRVSPVDGMPQVLIPDGVFTMGSPLTEPGRGEEEGPVADVSLPSFWIDAHEVTNAQLLHFLQDTNSELEMRILLGAWVSGDMPPPQMPAGFTFAHVHGVYSVAAEAADLPVCGVFWRGAAAYARWAGRQLPSEAQWERAARGGTATAFPWGDTWRQDSVNNGTAIMPVGSFPPNGFGLFDVIGNVREFCADEFRRDLQAHLAADTALAPAERGFRSVRGGNFGGSPPSLRVARRLGSHEPYPDRWAGFRCVEPP